MKLEIGNLRTRLLLSLCGLLTLVIVAEWLAPVRVDSGGEGTIDSVDAELPALTASTYVHPHIDDFAAILERPVFFQDRRLPPEPVAAPVAAPVPIRLTLQGVALVAEAKIAVLRDAADQQLVQLSEGMSHNGWNLETVSAESAIFRRGEERTELRLDLAASQRRRR